MHVKIIVQMLLILYSYVPNPLWPSNSLKSLSFFCRLLKLLTFAFYLLLHSISLTRAIVTELVQLGIKTTRGCILLETCNNPNTKTN